VHRALGRLRLSTLARWLSRKTTIGIIEIMKLMNAVPAGVAGEIREVCVGDGDPVEYDQVLMRVSP
jgi:acetyl-CoA carboxylase biotin carboxyl carrier protein